MSNQTRGSAFRTCEEVSARCPVSMTVLGYYPNLGANIFFAIAFGICFVAAVSIGIRKKTWSFMLAVASGTLLECVGYISRCFLYWNPFNRNAFQTQIVAIILPPTIICVGIYLTLKHVAININPAISRIRPSLYPWIFLPADASCLVVQAIGGGIAAAAGREGQNRALLDGGNRAIIAGIVLQVVVLLFFGITGVDYWVRVRKWIKSGEATEEALRLWGDRNFRLFGISVAGAFACILIRCIYRIAEMAGGWGNHIMQDEPSFMVLDSAMVLIAVALLSFLHPGILFPQMATPFFKKKEKVTEAAPAPSSSSQEQKVVESA